MGSFVENINKVAKVITSGVLDPNAEGYSNAVIASNMAEVCTNIYDQFDDRYLGSKSIAPMVDNDGNSLVYGALFFDNVNNFMKVWSNAGWINVGSSETAYTVATVENLVSVPSDYTTAIVKDLDRGGTFVWSSTGTANGVTVFAGATGYWNRQYSGAVNVKWFGAKGDGVTDDTDALIAAIAYLNANSYVCLEFPAGNYLVTRSVATPDIGGRSCFSITSSGWTIRGKGRDVSKIIFSQTDGFSARLLDIHGSNSWTISDISVEGVNVPTSYAGTDLSRALSCRTNSHFEIKNFGVKNVQSYAIAHQVGPFYNGLWENIRLENVGNDGIDIKNWDSSGNFAGNRDLTIKNIEGINVGMFTEESPNVVVDMRGRGIIDGVFARLINPQTIGVRISPNGHAYLEPSAGTGTQKSLISNINITGTSTAVEDYQIGIQFGAEDVIVSNAVLTGLHFGVYGIQDDNSAGRGSISGAVINDCFYGIVAAQDRFRIIDSSFARNNRGIQVDNNTQIIGCNFSGTSQLTMAFGGSSTGSQVIGCTNVDSLPATTSVGVRGTITAIGNTGFGSSLEAEGYTIPLNICGTLPTLAFRNNTGAKVGSVANSSISIDVTSGEGTTDRYRVTTGGGSGGFHTVRIDGADTYRFAGAYIRPETDNTKTLGLALNRWSVIYAGTGTINTSDAREKTFSDIPEVETQVAKELKSLVRRFKFNDAIESKGTDKARIHYGTSSQEVIAVFEKYGLDAMQYAMVCYDEWEETPEVKDEEGNVTQAYVPAGNRYGIRYEELLCFIISAM